MRNILLFAPAALWLLVQALQAQAPAAVTLAVGHFGGTDQEIEECDFAIGSGSMLMLHPKGEPCVLARELVGRTGRLVFVVD